MAMPDLARRYTVAEVLEFPEDGNRYEVVQGELLVTPSPRRIHQLIIGRLLHQVGNYLNAFGLADLVLTAPADITWGIHPDEADELVQPDIFVVHPDDEASSWLDVKRLVLAIEVVSPSSTRADRVVKRKAYQRHQVPAYWVIDPDSALAELWSPNEDRPVIVTDAIVWKWNDAIPELRIVLADLFAAPRTSPSGPAA
jgi:Uma2 family endonuclease